MASAPQSLPLFYNTLEPLSSEAHAKFKVRPAEGADFVINQHAIPVTVEEFPLVQRQMPIIFSQGDDPVPLALMGLNEGVNVFIDEKGLYPPLPLFAGPSDPRSGGTDALLRPHFAHDR